MSSKTINTLRFSPGFCPSIFYEHLGHQMSSQKKKNLSLPFHVFSVKIIIFLNMGLFGINIFYKYLVKSLLHCTKIEIFHKRFLQ